MDDLLAGFLGSPTAKVDGIFDLEAIVAMIEQSIYASIMNCDNCDGSILG